ncbi:hypothetical protein ACM66B_003254 [Microbotryomycetes sp. NB124-2]
MRSDSPCSVSNAGAPLDLAGAVNLKRVVLACKECRIRKCKCDGVESGCHNCVINGRTCLYVPVTFEENLAARAKKKLGHPGSNDTKRGAAQAKKQPRVARTERKNRTALASANECKPVVVSSSCDIAVTDAPEKVTLQPALPEIVRDLPPTPSVELGHSLLSSASHSRAPSAAAHLEPDWLSDLFTCSPTSSCADSINGYPTPALSDTSPLCGVPFSAAASLPTTPSSSFKNLDLPCIDTVSSGMCPQPPVVTADSSGGYFVWIPVSAATESVVTPDLNLFPATPVDLRGPSLVQQQSDQQSWHPLPPTSLSFNKSHPLPHLPTSIPLEPWSYSLSESETTVLDLPLIDDNDAFSSSSSSVVEAFGSMTPVCTNNLTTSTMEAFFGRQQQQQQQQQQDTWRHVKHTCLVATPPEDHQSLTSEEWSSSWQTVASNGFGLTL